VSATAVIPLLLACASLSAWGQSGVLQLPGPPPLALPKWLAPFPQARDRSTKATPTEAASSYTALGLPADVISHYEQQLNPAGVAFQTKPDGTATVIEGSAEKASWAVRVREENGAARVEVSYALKRNRPPAQPTAPADRMLPALRLEWPEWLQVPGGRLTSQRTNPAGRVPTWSVESCPGDVIAKPSQGCLARVYESSSQLGSLYEYLGGLLEQHGYTAQSASPQPGANLELGKWIAEPFAQLKVREYPVQWADTYYRQIHIFLRQPKTPTTKIEITFMVKNGQAVEAPVPVSPAPAPSADGPAWYEAAPQDRNSWRWLIQSVATRSGPEVKYSNLYYEQATTRTVEGRLPLPAGGVIVHAFPVDCAFYVQDERGNTMKFANAKEAIGKPVGPGNWTVYPVQVRGVVVYFR
jgi:hypothetical protein